jgi:hypothetical protein
MRACDIVNAKIEINAIFRTDDLGGSASTDAFAEAIARRL